MKLFRVLAFTAGALATRRLMKRGGKAEAQPQADQANAAIEVPAQAEAQTAPAAPMAPDDRNGNLFPISSKLRREDEPPVARFNGFPRSA